MCPMCYIEHNSNVQMLLGCRIVKQFLQDVEAWIKMLGWQNLVLTDNEIIIGEMEQNNRNITIIILYAKVSRHPARINEKYF